MDSELFTRVVEVLEALGPFAPGATRAEKWRTTDQLANELQLFGCPAVNRLDQMLCDHEAQGLERMEKGLPPERAIRRAKYPDRTTALPLWGSTKLHGQPWSGHRPDRSDCADDLPSSLAVPDGAPDVFLSHTHDDASLALGLAEALSALRIRCWRFETHIEQRGNIADCVRAAIAEADLLVALVTRSSIASLWVLTELHTSLQAGKGVALVVDAEDALLLRLLESTRFQNPDNDFDLSVKYHDDTLRLLKNDYESRPGHSRSRADRFEAQTRDFLATLPLYLGEHLPDGRRAWRPALAFPHAPAQWSGFVGLSSLDELPLRLIK